VNFAPVLSGKVSPLEETYESLIHDVKQGHRKREKTAISRVTTGKRGLERTSTREQRYQGGGIQGEANKRERQVQRRSSYQFLRAPPRSSEQMMAQARQGVPARRAVNKLGGSLADIILAAIRHHSCQRGRDTRPEEEPT